MGSIEQWHTIRAANAAEELVAHARAEELRRQGAIAPTAGVADAREHDRQVRAANMGAGPGIAISLAILAGFVFVMYMLVSCAAATF